MNQDDDDMGLKALLEVSRNLTPTVSEDLLRNAYNLQTKYQFEKDRDVSLNELKRLVEENVTTKKDEGNK